MGTIVRTAGIGRTTEELQWDLDYQAAIWKAIQEAASERKAPFLIYQESNIIVRGLRDYFRGDIGEIIADETATHAQAAEFIKLYMPQNERKLKLYQDDVPLFNRYQVESQIETAFRREVRLPSGGALVIDHTEALISIDINSARATKGSDIEDTATNTNLEAADEVARQLRLRDLGGLVVIDFIDMMASKHQRAVENRLRDALKQDRARVQVGRISKFGLLEMSRQRLRPSLGESSENVCPRCHGHGTIRGIESTALSILRLVEEEAMKDNTGRVLADVPIEVATYLLNEKRQSINEIEARNQCTLLIVANPSIETPNYSIERIRTNDAEHESASKKSYELAADTTENYSPKDALDVKRPEAAAVSAVTPLAPAPTPANRKQASGSADTARTSSGFSKIFGAVTSLFGGSSAEDTEDSSSRSAAKTQSANRNRRPDQKTAESEEGRGRRRNTKRGGNRGRGKGRSENEATENSNDASSGKRTAQRRGKQDLKDADSPDNRTNAESGNKATKKKGNDDQTGSGRISRSKGRGRGKKNERSENLETENDPKGKIQDDSRESGSASEVVVKPDQPDHDKEADSADTTRTRGRRGGRRRGGRGRGRNADKSTVAADNADEQNAQKPSANGVNGQSEELNSQSQPAESAPPTSQNKPSGNDKGNTADTRDAVENKDSQVPSADTVVTPTADTVNEKRAEPASQPASDSTQANEADSKQEAPAKKPRAPRKPRLAKKVELANAKAAEESNASSIIETGKSAVSGTAANPASATDQPPSEAKSSETGKGSSDTIEQTPQKKEARKEVKKVKADTVDTNAAEAPEKVAPKPAQEPVPTPESTAVKMAPATAPSAAAETTVQKAGPTKSAASIDKTGSKSDRPTQGSVHDKVDSRKNAVSDAVADTSAEPKVSQRQPSQLKSSVRSLANKDANDGSFASRKQVDVAKPAEADTSSNSARTPEE